MVNLNKTVYLCIVFFFLGTIASSKPSTLREDNGIAFAFSGAGGRIAQHYGLMEALVKGLYPSGVKIRPSYLAGASSGAISAVTLSAILQTIEQNLTSGFTWEDARDLLFSLSTGKIIDISVGGIAKIFTVNVAEGFLLDNTPMENFMRQSLAKMGYKYFGDLYLPTSISIVNQTSGQNIRLWSTDPLHAKLDLLELVMASAALPIAFRPRRITGFPGTDWIDGGTGIDTIPIYPLLQHPEVKKAYIICYASALTSGGAGDLPSILGDIKLLVNALATIDDMRVDLFAGAIEMAAKSSIPSYSFIPSFNTSFSALDFDDERLEYNMAMGWAIKNDPALLVDPTKKK